MTANDDGPVFDQVDEAGVPNDPEAEAAEAWIAAQQQRVPIRPDVDPYDDTIPVSQRLGSQQLYEENRAAAAAAAPKPVEGLPKRRRFHLPHVSLRSLSKRWAKPPASRYPVPLQLVEQTGPTPRSKRVWLSRDLVSSGLEIVGLAGISVGAGMVYHPAGLIVGGVSAVVLGVAAGR